MLSSATHVFRKTSNASERKEAAGRPPVRPARTRKRHVSGLPLLRLPRRPPKLLRPPPLLLAYVLPKPPRSQEKGKSARLQKNLLNSLSVHPNRPRLSDLVHPLSSLDLNLDRLICLQYFPQLFLHLQQTFLNFKRVPPPLVNLLPFLFTFSDYLIHNIFGVHCLLAIRSPTPPTAYQGTGGLHFPKPCPTCARNRCAQCEFRGGT
jgi:hypothetical protein